MQRLLEWWNHVTWAYPREDGPTRNPHARRARRSRLLRSRDSRRRKRHDGNATTGTLTKNQVVTTLVPETRTVNGHIVRFKVRRVVHYTPIYKRVVRTINGATVTTRKLVGRRAVTVSKVVTSSRTSTVTGPGHTVTATRENRYRPRPDGCRDSNRDGLAYGNEHRADHRHGGLNDHDPRHDHGNRHDRQRPLGATRYSAMADPIRRGHSGRWAHPRVRARPRRAWLSAEALRARGARRG